MEVKRLARRASKKARPKNLARYVGGELGWGWGGSGGGGVGVRVEGIYRKQSSGLRCGKKTARMARRASRDARPRCRVWGWGWGRGWKGYIVYSIGY